jgi:PAS domain S-box-containing protein
MEQVDEKADLVRAFDTFIRGTKALEESYRRLESRIRDLDQELEAKNHELALATDYFSSVLESMSDGVIAIGIDGAITTFNAAASDVLGYKDEHPIGKSFTVLFGREFAVMPGRTATELRSKDGKPVPVTERDSPIVDRSGRRIGTVKVFQDLREIEALREQVRHKDRLAAVGEMAATVAHEIRNPLGGIRGFAALLARDIPRDDARYRLVEKVLEGTRDLDAVVGELLEYTRPLNLRVRESRCRDLVDAALGYVEVASPNIAISCSIPSDLIVRADPDKLRQVLLNILLNAVQSISGSGTISIDISAEAGELRIEVRDSGCGIAPDQLRNIFSPFFTTKEKGTGLGLAVAEKIVEAHGGTIEAQSKPDDGSVFTIRLPQAV